MHTIKISLIQISLVSSKGVKVDVEYATVVSPDCLALFEDFFLTYIYELICLWIS